MIAAVAERASALAAGVGMPEVTGGIVAAVDYAPAAKVTVLLFGADGRASLVGKLARRPESERALVAEHTALASLWSAPSPVITEAVPRPLGLERIAGRLVLFSTAVSGTPLTVRYYQPGHVRRPGAVARDFAAAGAWLARLHEQTRGETVTLGPDVFGQWIHPVFERYRAEVGWSGWETGLLDHLAGRCASLSGTGVPVVAVHGDYAPGNILLDAGRVSGVVDWELGQPRGLPFSDLFKFAASYGSYLDRACPPRRGRLPGHPGWSRARERWGETPGWTNRAGIMYAFFGAGWFPDLVAAFLDDHFRRLGIPLAAMELFFPVFLAEQALAQVESAYRTGYRELLRVLWDEGGARRTWPVAAAV